MVRNTFRFLWFGEAEAIYYCRSADSSAKDFLICGKQIASPYKIVGSKCDRRQKMPPAKENRRPTGER